MWYLIYILIFRAEYIGIYVCKICVYIYIYTLFTYQIYAANINLYRLENTVTSKIQHITQKIGNLCDYFMFRAMIYW